MQLYLSLGTRKDVTLPLVPNLHAPHLSGLHILICRVHPTEGDGSHSSVFSRQSRRCKKKSRRVHTGRRLAGVIQGPNNGLLSAADSACVCIATNSSSVVCSCAVGFVSDGQSGCKSESMQCPVSYVSLITLLKVKLSGDILPDQKLPVLQADCACASGLVPPLAPPVPVPIPALSLLSEQPQLLLQSQKAQLFVQSWQSQLSLQPHQS
eukprot:Em0436g5a